MSNLVSTEWLAQHLDAPDVVILDASWHLPAAKRDARAEYLSVRIPGARFFDIDALSDRTSPLPHMLPAPAQFASGVKKLGVGDGKKVICYDSAGLFSAARCWWMFKVMGHDDVAVLDGGLPKWQREGRPLEDEMPVTPQERHFTPRVRASMVKGMADVAKALDGGAAQVADARSGTRFRGEEQEPRPGVRPGHMPGAKNVHYASLLRPDGTMKAQKELSEALTSAGIDLQKPIITSCGSGVTAAILSLALTELGAHDHALYDGSWTEWGASSNPVATG
ncbi:MAG: 3-mercaptopyruvate sulfurtransferase [Rhizobiales bacterium]|nr:3-mercaptopyruvate sulfurtransferase [Hyphomicrobiales bacterium]